MNTRKFAVALLVAVTTITLLGCASTPSVPPAEVAAPALAGNQDRLQTMQTTYSKLAESGGKVLALNPKTSAVRIYAFRAGRAAKAGHNHVLSAPQFNGFVYLPESGLSDARFDLEFRLDQLEIDNPENRSALGSAFASTPTPDAIEGTRNHMLGVDLLQAERFPFVRIQSLQIAGEAPKLALKVQVELHGQKRELWLPANVEGLPDHLLVTGSFVLRQTDFGVQPYSVLGGLLAVQDEVVIEFKLASRQGNTE